jgi:hypothetical protein
VANTCDKCGDADSQDNYQRFRHAASLLGEVAAGYLGGWCGRDF